MNLRARLDAIERRLPPPFALTDAQRERLRALATYSGDNPNILQRQARLMELAARVRARRAQAAGRASDDAATTP